MKEASHTGPRRVRFHLHEGARTARSTDTASILVTAWVCVGAGRGGEVTANGCKVFLEGDENVLRLNYGDGCTIP